MKQNSIDDGQLWHTFKNGDTRSFECIYNTYSIQLIQYGLKICPDPTLVEDSLHDLFVELWNSRSKLADVKKIKLYLISAMRYKIFAALRKSKSEYSIYTDAAYPDEAFSDNTGNNNALEQSIHKAIEKLPQRQKEVIYLHFYLCYNIKEIAELLQINYQSVANLLQRSISSMRKNSQTLDYFAFLLFVSTFFRELAIK